jgi:hypothetical protein
VLHGSSKVSLPFSVSHPNGFATFSLSLIKGVNAVTLPTAAPTSGPMSASVSAIAASVTDLMGTCDIAGFGEWIYVAATATNGWGDRASTTPLRRSPSCLRRSIGSRRHDRPAAGSRWAAGCLGKACSFFVSVYSRGALSCSIMSA